MILMEKRLALGCLPWGCFISGHSLISLHRDQRLKARWLLLRMQEQVQHGCAQLHSACVGSASLLRSPPLGQFERYGEKRDASCLYHCKVARVHGRIQSLLTVFRMYLGIREQRPDHCLARHRGEWSPARLEHEDGFAAVPTCRVPVGCRETRETGGGILG